MKMFKRKALKWISVVLPIKLNSLKKNNKIDSEIRIIAFKKNKQIQREIQKKLWIDVIKMHVV